MLTKILFNNIAKIKKAHSSMKNELFKYAKVLVDYFCISTIPFSLG